MANSFKVEIYRSAKTLSQVLVALFVLQLALYGLYSILAVVQIANPDVALDIDDGSGLSLPLMAIGLLSILELLARLATIVVFLIWLYRVYSNLSPLKARDLEFTPGWAVGWWFIPFANLIKPYQAVAEAWRESDADYSEDLGFLTSSVENPWVFPIWWGSWILGNIFSRIADRAVGDTVSDAYPYLLILTSVFSAVAAWAAIWIVRDTTGRQELRFDRLGQRLNNIEPPPPPVFG